MTVLGDFFPDDDVRDHIERQLAPGRVLYLRCEFISPAKDKYLVLLSKESKCLLFMINSKIARFIQADKHLLACQVKLDASKYGFLDHDSWLNCIDVKSMLLEEIQKQLVQDLSRIKGELNSETIIQIRKAVQQAQTLSPAHKKRILASLTI